MNNGKGEKMADVVLTADRTLMSNYHNNEFLGFGTCAPPNFIPEWLYSYLFFPPLKTNSGHPKQAPYGLRKTEAQLLKEGFKVETVSPRHLGKYLTRRKSSRHPHYGSVWVRSSFHNSCINFQKRTVPCKALSKFAEKSSN